MKVLQILIAYEAHLQDWAVLYGFRIRQHRPSRAEGLIGGVHGMLLEDIINTRLAKNLT